MAGNYMVGSVAILLNRVWRNGRSGWGKLSKEHLSVYFIRGLDCISSIQSIASNTGLTCIQDFG